MNGNKDKKTGRVARRLVLGTLAGATLLSGSGLGMASADAAPAVPAAGSVQSVKGFIEPPGIGEMISFGLEIHKAVELCKDNKEAGLPCTQSTEKTVTEIYAKLDAYIKQYEVDQKRNEDAISQVSYDVKNGTYDQNLLALTSDFERAQVGMSLYRSYTQCSAEFVKAGVQGGKPGSCIKVDAEGNRDGDQPADLDAITRERDAFVASQDPAKYNVKGANDMLNRVGGTKANAGTPYNTGNLGLLNKLVDRDRAEEKTNLGLGVSDKLKFMGPGYVNKVGADVTSLTNAEADYFIVRGLEQGFVKRSGETGNEWANAATKGGGDDGKGGVKYMGIPAQVKAFTFPDWSPATPMKDNTAYVQLRDGSYVMMTDHGVTTGKPGDYEHLLTPEKMAEISDVVGPILGKGKATELYPKVLPAVTGNRPLGNAAKQAGTDEALTRWWTTPQAVTFGTHADGQDRVLLGGNLRGHQTRRMAPKHWKTRAASHVEQQALPYSVFGKPTDTIKGVHDAHLNIGRSTYEQYCGSDLTSKPFTCQGPRYNDGGAHSSTQLWWDAWMHAHGDPINYRGITQYQAPTWDWFTGSQGVAVRYDGITAANVTTAPVATTGLLNAAS